MSSPKKSLHAKKHIKSFSMGVEARDEVSRAIRSSLRQSNLDKRRLINHEDSDESDFSSAVNMNSTMKVSNTPIILSHKSSSEYLSDAYVHSSKSSPEVGVLTDFSSLGEDMSESECSMVSVGNDFPPLPAPMGQSTPLSSRSPFKKISVSPVCNASGNPSALNSVEPQPRTFRPPPIIISEVSDFSTLKGNLIKICGNNLEIKHLLNNTIKINGLSSDTYRSVTKWLNDQPNLSWHSWQLKEDRGFRCVVRGLYHGTTKEEFTEAFATLGHKVRSLTNVLDKKNNRKLNLFFVELESNKNNKDVFEITRLLNQVVKVEPPRAKPVLPQCHRCLDYGHTQAYCHKKPSTGIRTADSRFTCRPPITYATP
ncbi:hypothetical protein ACLKA6_005666 [Drosophila palustris]